MVQVTYVCHYPCWLNCFHTFLFKLVQMLVTEAATPKLSFSPIRPQTLFLAYSFLFVHCFQYGIRAGLWEYFGDGSLFHGNLFSLCFYSQCNKYLCWYLCSKFHVHQSKHFYIRGALVTRSWISREVNNFAFLQMRKKLLIYWSVFSIKPCPYYLGKFGSLM